MILFRPLNKTFLGGDKFRCSEMKSGFLSRMMPPENFSLYIIVQSVDTGIRGSLSCNFPVWIFPFTFISMASPLGSPVWLPFPWSHFSWLWLSTESVSPRRPLWKFSPWPHSKLANERCPLFTLRFYELWMIPWIWQILNKCLM